MSLHGLKTSSEGFKILKEIPTMLPELFYILTINGLINQHIRINSDDHQYGLHQIKNK